MQSLHIQYLEVSIVQNRFLIHRIGCLLCMIGMIMVLGALSYIRTEKLHQVSAPAPPITLVIDAGHGGDDGGAVTDSGVQEADLNLSISRRLCVLAELCGLHTAMTRSSDLIDYPDDAETIAARKVADQKQRVSFINQIPNAFLISIHQNQYPTAQPHGAQVLYGTTPGSRECAEPMQETLRAKLDPENRRLAAQISDQIYLMKNVHCPAVLIECGFLSNPEECSLLQTPEYQIKLTMAILSSYLQFDQNGCQT